MTGALILFISIILSIDAMGFGFYHKMVCPTLVPTRFPLLFALRYLHFCASLTSA